MNNQLISWSMFLLPWFTLAFMDRESIKRYFPVGLFASVTTVIVHDIGITYGLWEVREATIPFTEVMPYFFGSVPVLTMWIFKFTNGHLGLYMLVNIILDVGFAFFILGWLFPRLGLYSLVGITPYQVLLVNAGHALTLYVYQKWQEGETINLFLPKLQTVARKPKKD